MPEKYEYTVFGKKERCNDIFYDVKKFMVFTRQTCLMVVMLCPKNGGWRCWKRLSRFLIGKAGKNKMYDYYYMSGNGNGTVSSSSFALVAGYAVGGGHVLHMVCDLTIAADNAIFGQTGPKVGSFDAGYGSSIMSRLVGPKKAREMWFLARFYTASEAEKMGLVNAVVPCREILRNSPTAIRVLKAALNAVDDGHAGLQEVGGNATLIFYGTEEGNEGKTAYVERRRPNFSKFSRRP
ncbi:hypothetical protein GOBAR_DD21245 [Gossypium barbadense]|nr:hypothetical protein GOBAR_DD21245 [Gossypium barbadense]